MDHVACRQCGQAQELPSSYARPRYRCTGCGAVNDVPVQAKVQAPTPFDPEPPPHKPATAPEREPQRELLIQGTQNEEDTNPYTVRGDALTANGLSVVCRACGHTQDLPSGYARPRYRCTGCGAGNDVPVQAKVQAPTPFDPEPTPQRPATAPEREPQRELLIQGTQNEEDTNPYTVRGDALTATCPACKQPIRPQALVCGHCGVNLDDRKKAERTFVPVDQTWEAGWPYRKRMSLFVTLQAINAVVLVLGFVTGQPAGLTLSGVLFTIVLQAFLVGTYDRLHLTRTAKGKVTLTRTWRYAFVQRPAAPIRWKEHEGIRLLESEETDPVDWLFAALLFLYGVFPGILFWYYVIRPAKFDVALCKDHGYPALVLLRTMDKEHARKVMERISEVAVLPVLH